MTVNRYGLSRTIPADVKRLIRKKCGFGCIFCGNWLYEYEHIDPEYVDARVHDPEKMCLLCRDHHGKVTLGRLSKDQVAEQYQHPLALTNGYASDYLDFQSKVHVVLGRIFFHEPGGALVKVDDTDLLTIRSGEAGSPFMLSARFYDSSANLVLEIVDNEISALSRNWDIKQEGTRTIIRKARGKIALQLNIIPPDIIEIERIDMLYGSSKIYANSYTGEIRIRSINGALVDLPNAQIITQGITINHDGIVFSSAIFQESLPGIPMNKMDYRAFIDTGSIHSLPTQ